MENLENWKPVKNYHGYYEVSDFGNVKSLSRITFSRGKYPFLRKEKMMTGCPNNHGYLQVRLSMKGKVKTRKIHQLVAESFLNHIPNGRDIVVNHINFIRTDNRLKNLEVITNRDNSNRKHLKSSSHFTGVHWNKAAKKWKSQITINSKHKSLGYFETEIEASNAYEQELEKLTQTKF